MPENKALTQPELNSIIGKSLTNDYLESHQHHFPQRYLMTPVSKPMSSWVEKQAWADKYARINPDPKYKSYEENLMAEAAQVGTTQWKQEFHGVPHQDQYESWLTPKCKVCHLPADLGETCTPCDKALAKSSKVIANLIDEQVFQDALKHFNVVAHE